MAPAVWSVTLSLRNREGLEIRAAAENLLPGWGRGGERLSLLLRLRRRFLLSVSVTSQCAGRPVPQAAALAPAQPGTPRGRGTSRVVRFLRSRWARTMPRVTSIWRRKQKQQPPACVAAAAVPRDRRDQRSPTLTRPGFWAMAWTPKSAATLRFVFVAAALAIVVVAIVTAFRITGGGLSVKFLELMEHPPLNCNYKCLLGAPKRGLEWIFSKYMKTTCAWVRADC